MDKQKPKAPVITHERQIRKVEIRRKWEEVTLQPWLSHRKYGKGKKNKGEERARKKKGERCRAFCHGYRKGEGGRWGKSGERRKREMRRGRKCYLLAVAGDEWGKEKN